VSNDAQAYNWKDAYFRQVWETRAEQGAVDAIDGAQFRRAIEKWVNEGRPEDVQKWVDLFGFVENLPVLLKDAKEGV